MEKWAITSIKSLAVADFHLKVSQMFSHLTSGLVGLSKGIAGIFLPNGKNLVHIPF